MADQFQRVDPTPFSAPAQDPAAQALEPAGNSRWLLPALLALALLAVAVIFLLPKLVEPPQRVSAPASSAESAGGPAKPATNSDAPTRPQGGEAPSPFADALAAKARGEAQALLEELLDVKDNLVNRGAETWAAEQMAAVAAAAEAGDERYRERDFEAALAQYAAALDDALALERSIPERFEALRAELVNDIEALDIAASGEKLATAEQLQPGDTSLTPLRARVDVLPEVAAAAAQAAEAETDGDLATAAGDLKRAAELDPAHQAIARELARITDAWTRERFNTAMSEGYVALEARQFDRAQTRFDAAARLQPGSAETSAALTELSVARTAATLRALRDRGESLLADEDWQPAIDVFEEALAIDPTLSFARRGLEFARPRAELRTEFDAILSEPGRLVDDALLREAQASLQRGRAIADPGPRLAAQIATVARVLDAASTPVTVTLRSDGLTSVVVYKVARLGQFSQQQLSLRPGTYTAVGTRRGFRDVREEFTVTPGGLESPVTIACREAI